MNPAYESLKALPKAELHLHLEGSIRPATVVELAARHGVRVSVAEAQARYAYSDFQGFLEAFKWVTSFLRKPADYALITERLADELLSQNVIYVEVIFALGVMRYWKQDPLANFEAMHAAAENARARGLRLHWIPDAAWQFGAAEALEVARTVAQLKKYGVAAFGMGGDEMMYDYADFRAAFEHAAAAGLHLMAHAGEVGGPQKIRQAIEMGAERIGHGIAAMHDPALMATLAERRIPLENCPTSNVCTGALALQLGQKIARVEEHPLPGFLSRGVPVVLSTDDPAMFQTTLHEEYALGAKLGLSPLEMAGLAEAAFEHAFLPAADKAALLAAFRVKRAELGLV